MRSDHTDFKALSSSKQRSPQVLTPASSIFGAMDSGDASSVPKRRTRQQFLKDCVELIEKRNSSSRSGNANHSSTTCSVVQINTSCGGGDKTKIVKCSEDGYMVRSLEKGKKKVENRKRKLSPGNCESKSITKRLFIQEVSDPDDSSGSDSDDLEEEESGPDPENSGSGSVSWSNVGSVGLRSRMLNAADRKMSPSERRKVEKTEDFVDLSKSRQEFTDTSESETSSDEDDDDSEDEDYHESSSSSKSEDITSDFDDGRKESEKDDLSTPTRNQNNEEGKGFDLNCLSEQNNEKGKGSDCVRTGFDNQYDGRIVSEGDDLSCHTKEKNNKKGNAVENEKHRGRSYLLRPRSISKSRKKMLNRGSCSRPVVLTDDEGSEEEGEADELVQNVVVPKDVVQKDRRTRKKILKDSEFLRFVVDSIRNGDDHDKITSSEERRQVPVKETLPLVFQFEDEEPLHPEKQEWQIEIEDLFAEMEMCTLESCIGFTNPSVLPMQGSKVSGCQMGNHHLVLDEQIGLICKVCSHVHLEIKYIFPSFAERTRGRYERKYFGDSLSLLDDDGFRFYDSSAVHHSSIYMEGTVWDLVPMNAKAAMYPHQREGFEFMWKNIAGDIILENLREPLSDSRGGCIISHPPGTGKTRLTIVFLQAFLKKFPKCRPVIVAPSNLLLNWEAEFQKWEVDIPFHNLNSKDFSFQEDEATVSVFRCLSRAGKTDPQLIRMVKIRSWAKSKSVLGISYDLFRILTGEDGDGYAKEIREILLKLPGLLVLEEGHTARNEQSLVWQALNKVETEKHILLSGTPFQNNIKELYNTLCVVSPKFAADLEQKWTSLSSCIDKNVHALEELRDMIAPLVHRCSESVKKESLPGIRDTVIHLKPTDLQKQLLKRIPEIPGSFYKQNVVSLISVHPSLVADRSEFSD